MTLSDSKIESEKKALEVKIEEVKKLLFSFLGMLDALNQLDKLKENEPVNSDPPGNP